MPEVPFRKSPHGRAALRVAAVERNQLRHVRGGREVRPKKDGRNGGEPSESRCPGHTEKGDRQHRSQKNFQVPRTRAGRFAVPDDELASGRSGAQGVGAATTAAVVSASILILCTNYVITELFFSR